MKILSIDPGGTNGVALWNATLKGQYEMVWVEGVDKERLYKILETEEYDAIIYEGYRLYKSHSNVMINNEFETPQIIGVIKYLGGKKRAELVEQLATCKKFFTDDRLRDMGLYVTVDHRRDAIRHFLYWWYFSVKRGNPKDLVRGGQ